VASEIIRHFLDCHFPYPENGAWHEQPPISDKELKLLVKTLHDFAGFSHEMTIQFMGLFAKKLKSSGDHYALQRHAQN
jgi:hypothetical protein